MPSNPTVTSRAVLESLLLYRQRHGDALERLEDSEPDLAEYVMESLSHVHHELTRLGGSARHRRRVYRLVTELVLVSVDACRRAARSDPFEDSTANSREGATEP